MAFYKFSVNPANSYFNIMGKQANAVSMGKLSAPAFNRSSNGQLSTLAASFHRMRRSLIKAMKMLEDKHPRRY